MNKYIQIFCFALLISGSCSVYGQSVLKAGGESTNINRDAILELESTNKGVLLPRVSLRRLSEASPLSSFVEGMLVYNTNNSGEVRAGIHYCDGKQWIPLNKNATPSSVSYPSGGDHVSADTSSDNIRFYNKQLGSEWVLGPKNDLTGAFFKISSVQNAKESDYFVIAPNGNVGVGVSAPNHPFQLSSGAHVTTSGVWTNASDARLKKDVKNIRYGIEVVNKLRPVEYNMINTGEKQIGFIAQEVQLVLPEVVSGKEGDLTKGETLGISYGNMVAVLTKAIQEQQREIELLKQQHSLVKNQLTNDIESLKSEIQAMRMARITEKEN